MTPQGGRRRGDLRGGLKRDLERHEKRQPTGFWRSVSLIGAAGWPIALLTAGGALGGHLLDAHFGTGVRATLGLLALGAGLGTYAAFRALRGGRE